MQSSIATHRLGITYERFHPTLGGVEHALDVFFVYASARSIALARDSRATLESWGALATAAFRMWNEFLYTYARKCSLLMG